MKRWASLLLAGFTLLAIGNPTYAQSLTLGGKVGLVVANVGGDIEDAVGELDSKTGFAAGGFLTIGLSPIFDIQPEVLFVQKGAKQEAAGVEAKVKINYVEIPVLVRVNLPVQGATPIKPHVYGGPSISLELSCDIEEEGGGLSAEVACDDTSVGLETKSLDFGIVLGGGVGFGVGAGMLTVDGRYVLGLTDINDVAGSPFDAKNRAFEIFVGYGVNLGI